MAESEAQKTMGANLAGYEAYVAARKEGDKAKQEANRAAYRAYRAAYSKDLDERRASGTLKRRGRQRAAAAAE